jgi:TonB-dependent receptor-like protein/carboxypeptidase family protein
MVIARTPLVTGSPRGLEAAMLLTWAKSIWRVGLLIVVASWCILAVLAFADSGGTVSGHVKNEVGHALAGAFVELSGPTLPKSRVAVSDASGSYRFAEVSAGDYRLTFLLTGFLSVVKGNVEVSSVGSVVVDAVLRTSMTERIVVTGKSTFTNLADVPNPEESLIGIADAASQGAVTAAQIEARPILRPAEILETVPGLVTSQHSGEGKANQYYLRGFNLDHGTDFATTVAGMPVNMPTHAHGQGYSDLNFLIPELVSGVQYRKGPYDAEDGDFSTAGAADIVYTNTLPQAISRVWGGDGRYGRILFAQSPEAGSGRLLYAFEATTNDGPWVHPDDLKKYNGIVRYSRGDARNAFSVTAMGYDARWNSTDQVPDRAISSGLITRFGVIDPTDGGSTHRYSLSTEWQRAGDTTLTRVTGYLINYRLDLFSNFTYFLDDPVNGDQFEQADDRVVTGLQGNRSWQTEWFGHYTETTAGVQIRSDDIGTVGLYHTKDRDRLSTTRQDSVRQSSEAVYAETSTHWSPEFRTILGLRADLFQFHVRSDVAVNSGDERASIASPKIGLVLGPYAKTEFYLNAGSSYHSNDARGTTITVDPATLGPAERVTPLVRAKGAEVGVRTVIVPHLQSTLTIWRLDLDSELVFLGDAGTTEAGRPSHRDGLEWTNYYSPLPWLTLDADLASSRARFTNDDPVGDHIPGSLETALSGGIAMHSSRLFGSLRVRYFGPRPLIEDESVRSKSSTLVNGQFGCRFGTSLRATVDVYNLLNAEVSDIDYLYTSRLPGESLSGVVDVHTHPAVPRSFRAVLEFTF